MTAQSILALIQQNWRHYVALVRLDRPIGIYLLMWPTLWALWVAGQGTPSLKNIIVFVIGVVVMRSAGCAINDFADRDIDGQVDRTQGRPLATGKISAKEALAVFFALMLIAASLLLFLDQQTIYLAFGGAVLATIYPFAKRYTYFPQVVLGAAFAWAIPMAFSAEAGELSRQTVLLYISTLCWTIAYDTQYAMADREDDIKAGIKSIAIFFGDGDKTMIAILQLLALWPLWLLGQQLQLAWPFTLSLVIATALFAYQHWLIKDRKADLCLSAFLHNHWVGGVIFAGFYFSFLLKNY